MTTSEDVKNRHRSARLLALNSILVGLAAGLVVSCYRWLIPVIGSRVSAAFDWGRESFLSGAAVVLGMLAAGAAASAMVRREPMIGGSGIPQVAGTMSGHFKMNWLRVLVYKFLGGLITLGGGLTLGREGPSVQIGASVAQGYCKATERTRSEERYLIAGGAAAGLAAAFNAPISGLLFALEEVHRSFSSLAMVSALSAALASNFVSGMILGVKPVLDIPKLPQMRPEIYWLIILLGITIGLSGVLFNFLIVKGKALYAKLPIPAFLKPMIPFLLTALAVLWQPSLFGAGDHFIFLPNGQNLPPQELLLIYGVKLILLLTAFCSGLPGGIFFPLLILGSLVGNCFGSICAGAGLIEADWIIVFSVIAMSGHFAAIVRSPITGIMLMVEMTGSFSYLLPLGLVALLSYFTAELCRSEPIYESLLFILLKNKKNGYSRRVAEVRQAESYSREAERLEEKPAGRPDLMVEFSIDPGSEAVGKKIRDIVWPENILWISVKRGGHEILPKGHVSLMAGDYLVGLLYHEDLPEIEKKMRLILDD